VPVTDTLWGLTDFDENADETLETESPSLFTSLIARIKEKFKKE